MKIWNDIKNMYFDYNDPICGIERNYCQGRRFAFITVVDVGYLGDAKHPKHYWGELRYQDETDSIREIMKFGGQWPRCLENEQT